MGNNLLAMKLSPASLGWIPLLRPLDGKSELRSSTVMGDVAVVSFDARVRRALLTSESLEGF